MRLFFGEGCQKRKSRLSAPHRCLFLFCDALRDLSSTYSYHITSHHITLPLSSDDQARITSESQEDLAEQPRPNSPLAASIISSLVDSSTSHDEVSAVGSSTRCVLLHVRDVYVTNSLIAWSIARWYDSHAQPVHWLLPSSIH